MSAPAPKLACTVLRGAGFVAAARELAADASVVAGASVAGAELTWAAPPSAVLKGIQGPLKPRILDAFGTVTGPAAIPDRLELSRSQA